LTNGEHYSYPLTLSPQRGETGRGKITPSPLILSGTQGLPATLVACGRVKAVGEANSLQGLFSSIQSVRAIQTAAAVQGIGRGGGDNPLQLQVEEKEAITEIPSPSQEVRERMALNGLEY
jgi:hypothetical protein